MKKMKLLVPVFCIMLRLAPVQAQQPDTVNIKKNYSNKSAYLWKPTTFTYKSFVPPVLMVAYGFITLKSDPLEDFNEDVQRKIWIDNPHSQRHIDNYLQFAPAAVVYGLNIVGVHGKSNFLDRGMLYFISNAFMGVTISSVKSLTHELRPDRSDHLSFPSGHTGEAFVSAEFLRLEYKGVSAWYGVGGYAMATATGLLRIYNNKHWLSDVIAGAGVGIASTKLAYWIYPVICRTFFKKSVSHTLLMPYYQDKGAGLCMLYIFH